mmetsp:Transcript_563/g.1660  ORF Transcript_563/g.1660 Transcript_563/m.1660 type:complete len:217 (+) Transcript_563:2457-3107(+)
MRQRCRASSCGPEAKEGTTSRRKPAAPSLYRLVVWVRASCQGPRGWRPSQLRPCACRVPAPTRQRQRRWSSRQKKWRQRMKRMRPLRPRTLRRAASRRAAGPRRCRCMLRTRGTRPRGRSPRASGDARGAWKDPSPRASLASATKSAVQRSVSTSVARRRDRSNSRWPTRIWHMDRRARAPEWRLGSPDPGAHPGVGSAETRRLRLCPPLHGQEAR